MHRKTNWSELRIQALLFATHTFYFGVTLFALIHDFAWWILLPALFFAVPNYLAQRHHWVRMWQAYYGKDMGREYAFPEPETLVDPGSAYVWPDDESPNR